MFGPYVLRQNKENRKARLATRATPVEVRRRNSREQIVLWRDLGNPLQTTAGVATNPGSRAGALMAAGSSHVSSHGGSEYGCGVAPETQMEMAAPTNNGPQRPPKKREHRRQRESGSVSPGDIASSKHSMPTLVPGAASRAEPSSPAPRRVQDATGKTGDREDSLGGNAGAPAAPSNPPSPLRRRTVSIAQQATNAAMAQDGFNVFDIPLTQIGAADIELVEKDDPQTTRAWSPNGSPMKTSSKFPKGGDGSAHFQLSQDPSMKLTGGKTHRKSVGTLDEVSTMARAARVELTAFCSAVLPEKMTYWETLMFGMLIFNFRKPVDVLMRCIPLLDRHLKQRREFTRSIIAIGGLERVQLLIAIARFDTDGDNNVSEMEFMKSAYAGGVCVTNAVSGVQGFNLMASLIFVATHLANIGRPKPWYASPETVESFGAEESSIVMWVAYSLNCFAETLALSIMINSVFMRQLLVNALPSVHCYPPNLVRHLDTP